MLPRLSTAIFCDLHLFTRAARTPRGSLSLPWKPFGVGRSAKTTLHGDVAAEPSQLRTIGF
jgi:hypothetical protein